MSLSYRAMKFLKIFLFLFSAIFAGYTVMDVKPEVLELMTDVRAQFFINLVLTASFFDFTFKNPLKDLREIIIITICFTAFLYIFRLYFVKDKKEQMFTQGEMARDYGCFRNDEGQVEYGDMWEYKAPGDSFCQQQLSGLEEAD